MCILNLVVMAAELDDLLTFHSMQISQCIRLSSAFGGVPNVLDSLQKDFGFRFLEALGCFVCLEPESQLFCSRVEVLAARNRGLTLNLYAMWEILPLSLWIIVYLSNTGIHSNNELWGSITYNATTLHPFSRKSISC